jgi:CheY-like chemotaxis protein
MDGNLLRGKKILIVEDDFSSKLYLNKILERSGATIFNAGDGNEALEQVRNNPDIDLILMDIQLPVLDGYSCTRILRESGSRIIIIAQTAYGLSGDKEKIMSKGFNDFLIKPISQKQLIDKISGFLL